MALKRILPLKVSEKQTMVGFHNYVRTRLTPVKIGGQVRPPRPDSVRKVLSGERESVRMLLDIFQNGTDLIDHPSTGAKVIRAFNHWRRTGKLPPDYGDYRGGKGA